MTREFCNYTQSLALKELGFDEQCFGWYSQSKNKVTPHIPCSHNTDYNTVTRPWTTDEFECCSAPLYQQAFRWFREKEYYSEITTECTQVDGSVGFSWRIWKPWTIEEWSINKPGDEWSYETYEEAEQACLDKLIEITKTK
jgi:hypothetical protein